MRLFVTLFYILLSIFVVGIVLCCCPNLSEVFVRIAIGLVTGSLIAGVNALVNYFSQRKRYFSDLVEAVLEVGDSIYDEYMTASLLDDFGFINSYDVLRKYIPDQIKEREYESRQKEIQYRHYCDRFNYEEFASITPHFESNFLEELEDWFQKSSDFYELYVLSIPYLFEHCLNNKDLISCPESDSGRIIPDSFIDSYKRRCKDFRGSMAYVLVRYAKTCSDLGEVIKHEMSTCDYDDLLATCNVWRDATRNQRLINKFQKLNDPDRYNEDKKEGD